MPHTLDVTDLDAIAPTIAGIETDIGPIDDLINNAGYGVEGTFEETDLATFRRQFNVNVFGVVAVTQAALPYLHARRRGHILFVTSMGGLRSLPELSAYHGSKYAVEGIAASLAQEVGPLGVRVTTIEPGSFRTDWAGRSMDRVKSSIDDYAATFGPLRARREQMSGSQLENPALAGQAVLTVIDADDPPTHLLQGSDALQLVAEARTAFDAETSAWQELTRSTDFADGERIR